MTRVAIAEDQAIVRWALREALAKVPDIEVVGDAGNREETLDLIRREKPDVALFGLGQDVLAELRNLDESPLILVLAPHGEAFHAARAISSGAHGYISTTAPPEQLIDAIRAISRGERVIPAGVDALLAAGDGHPAGTLTKREMQVMEMIARGMTNREIAEDLAISIKTIDTHRGHILKKLGLRNNSELTRFAVKHGYVSV